MAKRLWRWGCFSLKHEIGRLNVWALLCFFAVVGYLLITVAMPEKNQRLVVLYSAEDGGLSDALIEDLTQRESIFTFKEVGSEEEALKLVRIMEADCGFVFPKDFSEKMKEGYPGEAATYLSHPSSLRGPAVKELVFEAFYRSYSKVLLEDIASSGKYFRRSDEAVAESVLKYNEKYMARGYTFSFKYLLVGEGEVTGDGTFSEDSSESTGGEESDTEAENGPEDSRAGLNQSGQVSQGARGVRTDSATKSAAVIGFLICVAVVLMYGSVWDEKGIYLKIDRDEKRLYRLVELCARMTPLACLGIAGLIWSVGLSRDTVIHSLLMPVYVALCAAWVMAIGRFSKSAVSFYGRIPVIVICTLAMSNCFVNVGEIIPALEWTKWLFPPTYFMIGF